MSLTALETAVLAEICKQLPPQDGAALEQQLDKVAVRNRMSTGGGFYTHFALNSKSMQKIHVDTRSCDVTANINGLDGALGFILWLKDGYVDYLEGYTMAHATTANMDLDTLVFELTSAPPPQWNKL